jgi:rod shape-determining protein MreC
LSGRISAKVENIRDYFSLHYENRQLAEENSRLYNRLKSSYAIPLLDTLLTSDSVTRRKYLFLNARVINNTVNKQYNFITIDKGYRGGVGTDMAVFSAEGIVGIVKSVSADYSSVLSLLNRDFTVSAKIKKNGYFGPLSWNGNSTQHAMLVDIPHHVDVAEGDTIVTSGFGGVFPEGLMIGVIHSFRLKGGNYYEIRVELSTDFRRLDYVQVIRNLPKPEIDSLENASSQ